MVVVMVVVVEDVISFFCLFLYSWSKRKLMLTTLSHTIMSRNIIIICIRYSYAIDPYILGQSGVNKNTCSDDDANAAGVLATPPPSPTTIHPSIHELLHIHPSICPHPPCLVLLLGNFPFFPLNYFRRQER